MSKKKAYEEKFKAQLDELNAKIDVLKAKANQAEAGLTADYYETIEDLQEKKSAAKAKLAEIGEASDDAWEDLKEGFESSWSNFAASVKSAIARFK